MMWKNITGYQGRYSVSTAGTVRNNKTGRVLHDYENGNGYRFIYLYKNGIRKKHYIHRLVAQHFLYFIPEADYEIKDYQVNHKNEVKTCNAISNLEYLLPSENINYGTRNDRMVATRSQNRTSCI